MVAPFCCCSCEIASGTVTVGESGQFVIPVADGSREVGLSLTHDAEDGETVVGVIFCGSDGTGGVELSVLVRGSITELSQCGNWSLSVGPGPWTNEGGGSMVLGRVVDEELGPSYRTSVGCVASGDEPPPGTYAAFRAPEGTVVTYSFFRVTADCTLPSCACDPYSPCGGDAFGQVSWPAVGGDTSNYGWQPNFDEPCDRCTYPSGSLESATLVIPPEELTDSGGFPVADGFIWFRVETCTTVEITVTATSDGHGEWEIVSAGANVFPVCVNQVASLILEGGALIWSDGTGGFSGTTSIMLSPGIYGLHFWGGRNVGYGYGGTATCSFSGGTALEACELMRALALDVPRPRSLPGQPCCGQQPRMVPVNPPPRKR
jgi:hypothetical protein